MSAVLKQISARVVHKPTYNNSALQMFDRWYAMNEAKLGEYFLALPTDHPDTGDDFRDFVLCQYDVECELQAAARRTTYGEADEGRVWDAETHMADFRR